jgi:hypothetical protein
LNRVRGRRTPWSSCRRPPTYDHAPWKVILEDCQRLWNNNALANLSIEIRDFLFSNGVIGKVVVYNITERN